LQLFTLVNDIGGNRHWIIIFAEITGWDIIYLEEKLNQTYYSPKYFLKILNCSVGLVCTEKVEIVIALPPLNKPTPT
jgi:hypothetical protein